LHGKIETKVGPETRVQECQILRIGGGQAFLKTCLTLWNLVFVNCQKY